jgi:hypothetical protein
LVEFPAGGSFDYLKPRFCVAQVLVGLLKQVFQAVVVFREVLLECFRFRCTEGASSIQAPFDLQEFFF